MKEFISWNVIEECVKELAGYLHRTGIEFNGVYGIPRGGTILAVMLSHELDVPYLSNLDNLYGKDFVIIDDIADTGKTLEHYTKLKVCNKAHYVTIHEHEQSIIKPNFSIISKEDKWIVYPWETDESNEIPDYLKDNINE
ncbi:MAG: hypothetical protein H8E03_01130 [Pelagibacteraceae bacterium]|nr:hypothetical protein [Pelagibacteraceae bacterium]